MRENHAGIRAWNGADPIELLLVWLLLSFCTVPDSATNSMTLVYDLSQDAYYRGQVLSGLEAQWQAYQRGEVPSQAVEGRITRLFFDSFDCKQMFELEEENGGHSFWVRRGNAGAYAVGRQARIEQVMFQAPAPVGPLPVVTRMWITENSESGQPALQPLPSHLQNEYCRTGRIAGLCRELRLRKRSPSPPAKPTRASRKRHLLLWPARFFKTGREASLTRPKS